MARHETPKEDLLRDTTALVERIEFAAADSSGDDVILVGFRSGGAASFFFGEDPVYQFNAAGQLRRAFCDGRLLKAGDGRLVALERVRSSDEVQLVRHELTDTELREFLARLEARLSTLAAQLTGGSLTVRGQVPADFDLVGRVQRWLAASRSVKVAASPRVG